MKKISKTYLIIPVILLSFIACFSLFVSSVSAQALGVKVSPLRIEKLVDPGEILEKSIKITNISDSPKTFYVYLRDFKAGDERGGALLIPPGSEEGPFLASWIKITSEGINFAPGEEKEIPVTIEVPKEAGPGGYYGAIVFGTSPPEVGVEGEEGGAAVAIGQQTGVLVLLQVSGDIIEDALIREFSTDRNFYSAPFKVNFLSRIKNLGNVHIKPHGTIEINNILGKNVATLRVNDQGANVLPNSIRRFENSWEGDFGFGRYKAILALSFGTFAHEGGEGRQTIYAERTFWILPWKIIVPVVLGLIFLAGIFVLFLKLYKSRAVQKALKEKGLTPTKYVYVRKKQGFSSALRFGLILFVLLFLIFLLIGGVIYFLFFS
jgi:hypothetical protein